MKQKRNVNKQLEDLPHVIQNGGLKGAFLIGIGGGAKHVPGADVLLQKAVFSALCKHKAFKKSRTFMAC